MLYSRLQIVVTSPWAKSPYIFLNSYFLSFLELCCSHISNRKACKFLFWLYSFLFFNRSKKMGSMKKLDYKRPFFRKTHARKFLGTPGLLTDRLFFSLDMGAPNPISHSWIFTCVSMGSRPCPNLFTSSTVGSEYPWYCAQVWHWTHPMWRF